MHAFEMTRVLRGLLRDRRGVTALEYGLIAALVAAVIIVTVTNLGKSLNGVFQYIAQSLVTP